MDVLQILRDGHSRISSLLKESAGGRPKQKELEYELGLMVFLEGQYLFPELDGLFANSDHLVAIAQAHHKSLASQLKRVLSGKTSQTKTTALVTLGEKFDEYQSFFGDQLMPLVRVSMPTQDREDLGELVMDAKAEFTADGPSSKSRQSKAKARSIRS